MGNLDKSRRSLLTNAAGIGVGVLAAGATGYGSKVIVEDMLEKRKKMHEQIDAMRGEVKFLKKCKDVGISWSLLRAMKRHGFNFLDDADGSLSLSWPKGGGTVLNKDGAVVKSADFATRIVDGYEQVYKMTFVFKHTKTGEERTEISE